MGQQRVCMECGATFTARRANHGYCSPACRKASHRGAYPSTRRLALVRDGHVCCECGAAGPLEVHHITPRSQGGSHRLDNLQTLCRYHHRLKHRKGTWNVTTATPQPLAAA